MPKIVTLPEQVARQIAAGEVVERPASVVKELVENALDAGASWISIRTSGAGVRLVEVRDNGCGMSPEDVRLAPKNFSTSKINSAEDLFRIRSYGFRGEALASISAVARLDLVSSDRDGGEGWRVTVEGKSTLHSGPAPHEKGTTVRVENLFFNTPARKKFLKSDLTERRRILETILGFALVSPELEIHYSEQEKSVLDLVPTRTWRDRIGSIMGASTMKHMVHVSSEDASIRLEGFVSLPTHTRGNRNHQFYFVNGRLVREKTMIRAVQEAYRSVIPYKRFPVLVLSLEAPFEEVDVNVHPTKLEVRLGNERRVFELVRRAIKRSLTARSESTMGVSYTEAEGDAPRSGVDRRAVEQPLQGSLDVGIPRPGGGVGEETEQYKTRVRDAVESYLEGAATRRDFGPQLSLQERVVEEPSTPRREAIGDQVQTEDALFWQFNNSYIFIQVRGGIVVIDQHAAHERIIFDTSKKQMESEIPVSQQILFPIALELSVAELEVFKTTRELFHKLGFNLEPFGGTSILVRGYPQGLKNWEEGRLLLQIFDDLLDKRVPGESHTDRIIASFACRSAVKAGQKLSVDEMKMLADQLFAVENPYSCPHGRPTIYRISLEDIERWFSRR
ncbi:MAG: DNA mismatch repair endonuclease MutL [Candidatus Latescibacterota bacterium]|nr:MAG: DNA mismatch repair endonuclease MutL [Candidatus Latescibacterota bacterium]